MLQSMASQSWNKLATKQQQLCQQGLATVSQNLPSLGRVSIYPGSCPKNDPQPAPPYLSLGLPQ